jgi:Tfp pilus assembly protein PilF
MSTRQSIGGRSSFTLYLVLILILALAVVLTVVFLVIVPDRQRQREAEAQRAVTAATTEARTAEVQRAYTAGVAFASAGDWSKAADEFAKAVSLDPGYKDAVACLADARTRTETAKVTATAQTAAAATAQALAEIESAYQRGLGYANLKRWGQAKVELEKVIAVNPNYKDVQTRMADVEIKLAEMTPVPTVNPTIPSPLIPTPSQTPAPTVPPPPTPTPSKTPVTKVLDISATGEWQDAGINLAKGQPFEITATGSWSHGLGDSVAPNPYGPGGCGKDDSNAVMPLVPIGVLIGRIGDESPFVVGERLVSVAGAAGRLQLSMNDAVGTYSDNSGYVRVTIRVK